jgi:hypothetical protein
MINKAKFKSMLVVWASLAIILFSATTGSGNDYDFLPYDTEPGWTYETFLKIPYLATAITFDAENNLYTNDLLEEISDEIITVYKYLAPEYDFDNPSVYVSYPVIFDTTNGIDFDGKGNLFVGECFLSETLIDAGLIRKIAAGNLKISEPVIFIDIPNVPGDGDFRPTGIAATGTETVYFPGRKWTMPGWGNIYRIGSFKKYDPAIGPEIVRPGLSMYAIADDKWGQIFVGRYSITARNPYTDDVVYIALFNPPKYVEEMAFDSDGNMYALEGDDGPGPYEVEILKIKPPHILIAGCDTGIIDWPLYSGSTIGGVIEDDCAGISSHGDFVSCVTNHAVDFMNDGKLSPQKVASIVTCASQASIP